MTAKLAQVSLTTSQSCQSAAWNMMDTVAIVIHFVPRFGFKYIYILVQEVIFPSSKYGTADMRHLGLVISQEHQGQQSRTRTINRPENC